MNRLTAYLIGPELVWLLLFALVRVLVSQNQPATPADNDQLASLHWYLALLGVLISFVPLFWTTSHIGWWLLRIGFSGLVGVFSINATLLGGIDTSGSGNAGLGTALFITVPMGWVLLLTGVGVVAIAHWLSWNFRVALKWMLIGIGCLTALFMWTGCSRKQETKPARKSTTQHPPTVMASYTWWSELCEHQGTYNSQRYSEKQLIDTYSLWTDSWYLEAPTLALSPADIDQLNVDSLHREYTRMQALLTALTPVKVPYWQALKQQRLRAMSAEYALKKLAVAAYANPALLRQTTYEPAAAPYVDALTSGGTTAMLAAWQALHDAQKKSNGLPDQLEKAFRQKYNAPDRLAHARVELMSYGWWNNVVPVEPYREVDERMEQAFKALFLTDKVTCEEP